MTKSVTLPAWAFGLWHSFDIRNQSFDILLGLPLPLGGNVIRRSLPPDARREVSILLRKSTQYALEHREEALAYAVQFSRGLDISKADRFVSMYVNDWTLDYGERGRQAVQTLLDCGFEKKLLPKRVQAEFVE